jgi:hypothetical protein
LLAASLEYRQTSTGHLPIGLVPTFGDSVDGSLFVHRPGGLGRKDDKMFTSTLETTDITAVNNDEGSCGTRQSSGQQETYFDVIMRIRPTRRRRAGSISATR